MMEGETSFLSDQARGDDLGQQFYSLATWKNKKDRSLKVAPHKHTHVPALPPSPGVEACGALHTAVPGPGSWCLLTRLHPQVNSVSWFCSLTYSTTHSCFCPANQHPRTLSINRLGTNYSNKSKDKDGGGGGLLPLQTQGPPAQAGPWHPNKCVSSQAGILEQRCSYQTLSADAIEQYNCSSNLERGNLN